MSLVAEDRKLVALWAADNGTIPSNLTKGSKRVFSWICKIGHKWSEAPYYVIKNKVPCPYCGNRKPIIGINDVGSYQELADEWNFEKNLIKPDEISIHSGKKVWWTCSVGHEWEQSPCTRLRSDSPTCMFCSGRKVLSGFNDLATTHPSIIKEWNYLKNEKMGIVPNSVGYGSGKKVWWLCNRGHEWKASISTRTLKGNNCPYCSNQKVLAGYNDLKTTSPRLMLEWNHKKNNILPSEITISSGKSVWWICNKGHEWNTSPNNRKYNGCPYCSNNRVISGVTDLQSVYPEKMKKWSNKNTIDPAAISSKSRIKALWVCHLGHEWEATVSSMKNDSGCPYCANKKVLIGFNDLFTVFPSLKQEWNSKNTVDSNTLTYGADNKVWWLCKRGHEWEAYVYARTSEKDLSQGTGCPKCSPSRKSKSERNLQNFVNSIVDNAVMNDRTVLGRKELDIYIPHKNIAIEFNGVYWHSDKFLPKNSHYDKWKLCKEKGIQLITVWEDDWRTKQDIIKQMLSHKIGVSKKESIYARETEFLKINSDKSNEFLNENHIQGGKKASTSFGLMDKGQNLVAIMSFSTTGTTSIIERYATSKTVVGGFSKLLKNSIKALPDTVEKIVSFSDHEVSDGGMYEINGFSLEKSIAPDYKYVRNNIREHKFLYRLKRFRDDPTLLYEDGLTELELARINKLLRVWDSGKDKWVLDISNK